MTVSALTRPGERDRLIVKFGEIDWIFCLALTLIAVAGTVMQFSIAGSSWTPGLPGSGLQSPLRQMTSPSIFGRVPPSPPVMSRLSVLDVLAPFQSPLTTAVSPDTCHPSSRARVRVLSHMRLPPGTSHV